MKKGFTLVELSIVLVIIGLLIGGILVGQNLIDSAKVKKMISNLQQYEIAAQNFTSKFRQLPGDSNRVAPIGNNDRNVDWGSNGCDGILQNREAYQFFYHLSATQMLNISLQGYSPAACGGSHDQLWQKSAGIYVPVLANVSAYANDYLGQGFDTDKVGIIYMFDYFATYARYLDAIAIDQKVDDGNPSTGLMRTGDDIDGSPCTSVAVTYQSQISKIVCELNYTKKFIL